MIFLIVIFIHRKNINNISSFSKILLSFLIPIILFSFFSYSGFTIYKLETIFETPKVPKNPSVLNDGTIYNIQFLGEDLATNKAESNLIENVKYDITRPVITIFYPTQKSIFHPSVKTLFLRAFGEFIGQLVLLIF